MNELTGCGMIRLTALLCGAIFLGLLIGGQDDGQVRQGLMKPAPEAAILAATPAPTPAESPLPEVTEAVFVPAQPVMVAATPAVVPALESEPTPPAVQIAEPNSEPAPALIAYVDARSINVRAGPSTDQEVIGRLTRGEAVLIVQAEADPEGWSLVRIEGDGIEGYVATRLLTDQEP